MTLLTPLALLGLLLLPGLVALHLHRRQLRTVEIPSLIVWQNLVGEPAPGGRRWRIEYVLLLILQIIAVCALVFSLARAANITGAGGGQVYVLDRGVLMTAPDPAPSRFDTARSRVMDEIRRAPSGTTVTVILADAQPRILVSTTDHALALRLLGNVNPVAAKPNIRQAISLGAGFLGSNGHMWIVYAKGDVLPPLSAPSGVLTSTVIGKSNDDQAISRLSVRCVPGAASCNALATLHNNGTAAVRDEVVINADGMVLGRQPVQLPPRSDTDLSFAVPATHRVVELYLTKPDLVAADNLAWAIIPAFGPATVTIVGDAAHTAPIAKALSAVPNVHTVVLTPSRYHTIASGVPGLLILAGWMPSGGLPATPSLLLFDPPRFPGAPAPSVITDTGVSDEDPTSPLLAGVDLTSLDIPQGAGEHLVLPQELHPVVWAATAPLITAGVLGGRHIVTVAFSPTASNLSRLDAFPVLMANIVQGSSAWLPSTVSPGERLTIAVPPVTSTIVISHSASLNSPATSRHVTRQGAYASADISSPGIYRVVERGAWGERDTQLAANAGTGTSVAPGGPLVVSPAAAPAAALGAAPHHTVWWPWLGLLAAVAIALEWLFATLKLDWRT
jgi:hypothetical protein